MKHLVLNIFFCFTIYQGIAQKSVHISGQIENFKAEEAIYLGLGPMVMPLEISPDGAFAFDGTIETWPAFFYLAEVSPKGKMDQQIPQVWFAEDSVAIKINWSDKSYQVKSLLPFQAISEKIEALSGKDQVTVILNNPNQIPSLFFAVEQKEKMTMADLQKLSASFSEESRNSVYGKKINSYIAAKSRRTLKKGQKVEDFSLPNKTGKHISVVNNTNKPTLITLFSSGCQFSLASLNLLEQFAEMSKGEIEIVTIWEDPTKSAWLNSHLEKKKKITWTSLWDEYGFAATYLNREIWPTFYVIDSDGVLIDKFTGYNKKTGEKLKKLL